MKSVIQRELKVAFSRKAQPLWFRITKWAVVLGLLVAFRDTPFLWAWLGGALLLALALHFLWRWKTRGWTQSWGGWDDLDAGKP